MIKKKRVHQNKMDVGSTFRNFIKYEYIKMK